MNSNPLNSYILGTVTVTEENTQQSYAESYYNDLKNYAVSKDIARFEKYFNKPVDYKLDLTIDLGEFIKTMADLPCHEMGGIVMGDCTDEERTKFKAEAKHEKSKIEWEDEMNVRASGEMIKWIIEDSSTKKQNKDIEMTSKVGEIIKIRLFNDPESKHPMQHPIHLHGQRFIVTEIDGKPVGNKVWTDTILVPIGSTIDILIDVTNPGEWM